MSKLFHFHLFINTKSWVCGSTHFQIDFISTMKLGNWKTENKKEEDEKLYERVVHNLILHYPVKVSTDTFSFLFYISKKEEEEDIFLSLYI